MAKRKRNTQTSEQQQNQTELPLTDSNDKAKNGFVPRKDIMEINSILDTDNPENGESWFQRPPTKKVRFADKLSNEEDNTSITASVANVNSNNSLFSEIIKILKTVEQESHKIVESTESVLKDHQSNSSNNNHFEIDDNQDQFLRDQAAILKQKTADLEKEHIKLKLLVTYSPPTSATLKFDYLGDVSENSNHHD